MAHLASLNQFREGIQRLSRRGEVALLSGIVKVVTKHRCVTLGPVQLVEVHVVGL